jgi:hypothetical protein
MISPVWDYQISVPGQNAQLGQGSIAPSAYDSTATSNGSLGTLYIAGGNAPTSGNTPCVGTRNYTLGSLQAFDLNLLNPAAPYPTWWACFDNYQTNSLGKGDGPVLGAVAAIPNKVVVGEGSWIVVADHTTLPPTFTYNEDPLAGLNGAFWGGPSISHDELYIGDVVNPTNPTGGTFYQSH